MNKTADTNDGVCAADCSLREAITAANSSPTDDEIVFSALFDTPQNIILNGSHLEILAAGNLSINGKEASLVTVNANNLSRVFSIAAGAEAALNGLTISGGNLIGVNGGGVFNAGSLSIRNSVIRNNRAKIGGGTYNDTNAVLVVSNSTFISNVATDYGGGFYNHTNGTLRVENTEVRQNSSTFNGGGISNNGNLTVERSLFTANTTRGGAAIFNDIRGAANINLSTFDANIAEDDGGGLYNSSGTMTVRNSTVSNNTAGNNDGGGGIINVSESGNLTVINSTISGNTADAGGGIHNHFGAALTVSHCTVVNNTARYGGGISNQSGTASLANSIVADNRITGTIGPDYYNRVNSQGFNLIENTNSTIISGTTTGNIIGQDPQLLRLSNYGGPTKTHALRPTSPAIDKGNSFGITGDQRQKSRPFDNPVIPNSAGNGADIGAFERQNYDAPVGVLFDHDGDTKADIGIYRPVAGEWWINYSETGQTFSLQFGQTSDKITPADFTGDGKTDVAFWRSGQWFVLRSENLSYYGFSFGSPGDIPVPADYDGDGKADAAVFRPSNATWYIQRSSDGGYTIQQFGITEDRPVVSDYDGDGKADLAVFRPTPSEWWILKSGGGTKALQFGANGDKVLPADYTGDGKADVAFWRPSNGFWYILRSEDDSYYAFPFGGANDLPAPGDYDGDGKTDVAIFRPSNSTWYMQRSVGGFLAVQFGLTGDQPIPSAFVR